MKQSMKQIETHPIEDTNGMFAVTFNGFFDNRGYLFKYFTPQLFEPIRKDLVWRQVIIQQTEKRNTIRGIHAQAHPFVESKLLVALRGKMFWVCVDLRKDSPRFGKWNHFVLDASTNVGLYVERGFAHGCCSLEDVDRARGVCSYLDIRHYVVNAQDVFTDKIVNPFVEGYSSGETPSPCIKCNSFIKFGFLFLTFRAIK